MKKSALAAVLAAHLMIPGCQIRLQAQQDFSLDESMECFRASARVSAPCEAGVTPIADVIYGWCSWNPTVVDQVAEALVDEAASSDVERSIHAIVALGQFGAPNCEDGELEGWPGAMKHLEQAFLAAPHPEYVLRTMPMQTDRAAVVRFLSRVVRGELRPDAVVSRRLAAHDLIRAGASGETELRMILKEGIDEPAVAHEVDRLLRQRE